MNAHGAAAQIDPITFSSAECDEPPRSTNERHIRAACERFGSAWSAGDVDLLASLLADECDHMTLAGGSHPGCDRAELIERFAAAFAHRDRDFSIRMRPSLRSIRLLSDRFALLDGQLEYTSGIGAAGVLQGRLVQPFSALMTATGDAWLILSIRVGIAVRAGTITADA